MDKKELEFILQEGEGLTIEFKESFDKSIAKEIVAFANAEGGRVFIGIDDNNKIKGICISNKLKSQIQDCANNCDPPASIKLEECGNVLIIDVEEGTDKPYKCKEGFYLRKGPNSQKKDRDDIIEFATKAGKLFFDSLLCKEFNFENDFDNKKFELFLKRAKISNILDTKQALANLGLTKNGKITNAGAMLFAKDLNKIYYHALVTCVRFKSNDRSHILDRKNFNEDIISNIENAVNFVLQYIPLRYEIEGLRRKEFYEIPEDAVREAVVNAVVHRDYFEQGANVQINIFDNKVEITNPGGLVDGLKKEEFGKKSISRNPLLLFILSKTEFVEKIGTGIRRIRESAKRSGLEEPFFEFNGFFTIVFKRPGKTVEKTVEKNREKILAFIKDNPYITARDLAEKTKLSRRGIEWNIQHLKQKGILKRVGPAKGGHWKIIK